MKIAASSYKKLIGLLPSGEITSVPCDVLRKPPNAKIIRDLKKESICIVCNYMFKERSMSWPRNIKAICHPFRDFSVAPKDMPKFLLSESDFYDQNVVHTKCDKIKHKFDLGIFTIDSLQGITCKGLFMVPYIIDVAVKMGLSVLLLDYAPKHEVFKNPSANSEEFFLNKTRLLMQQYMSHKKVKVVSGFVSEDKLCQYTKSCKFVVFPNNRDASPRMIPETLVRNVPVLVNENIYGGWKYVNDDTGMFFQPLSLEDLTSADFQDKKDIFKKNLVTKIDQMLNFNSDRVSESFGSQFGFLNASQHLARIINPIIGSSYVAIAYKEWKKQIKHVKKRLKL